MTAVGYTVLYDTFNMGYNLLYSWKPVGENFCKFHGIAVFCQFLHAHGLAWPRP